MRDTAREKCPTGPDRGSLPRSLAAELRALSRIQVGQTTLDTYLRDEIPLDSPDVLSALLLALRGTRKDKNRVSHAEGLARIGHAFEIHARNDPKPPRNMRAAEWDRRILDVADSFYLAAGLSLLDPHESALALEPAIEFLQEHLLDLAC